MLHCPPPLPLAHIAGGARRVLAMPFMLCCHSLRRLCPLCLAILTKKGQESRKESLARGMVLPGSFHGTHVLHPDLPQLPVSPGSASASTACSQTRWQSWWCHQQAMCQHMPALVLGAVWQLMLAAVARAALNLFNTSLFEAASYREARCCKRWAAKATCKCENRVHCRDRVTHARKTESKEGVLIFCETAPS